MGDKENSNQVCVECTGEFKQKFDALKKYYNLKSDTELIRILIKEKACQLNAGKKEATANANH